MLAICRLEAAPMLYSAPCRQVACTKGRVGTHVPCTASSLSLHVLTVSADEHIVWLYVSVQDPVAVAVPECLQQHAHVRLDVPWGQHNSLRLDQGLKVTVKELKHLTRRRQDREVGRAGCDMG